MPEKATNRKAKANGKMPTKLYRSETNRVIGGVCAGLGDFFQIDSTIVRFIFIIITLFGGGGILLYLVLWLIIPSDTSTSEITKDNIQKNAGEIKTKAQEFANDMKLNTTGMNSRQIIGIIILVFGLMLLMGSFGIVNFARLWKFFPAIIVIIIGIAILKQN